MNDPPVLLYRALDRIEAHLLKQELDAAGVRTTLAGGNSPAFGEVPMHEAMGTEMWVPSSDAERARQVLRAALERRRGEGSPEAGGPWRCASCGADNDPGFAVCWSCRAKR